ncbi:MAG: hypothetical protein JSS51_04230 [Planctomycetes bacterium]|nr:hypothetical protein [Planctomycetota bacterium]
MTFLFRFLTLIIALALTGCASRPTDDQLSKVDFGPPPANYKEKVTAYLRRNLKDPDSLKDLDVLPPVKAFYRDNLYASNEYGWFSMVSFNAKNGFGGYGGKKEYFALFGPSGEISRWCPLEQVSMESGAFGNGQHYIGLVK